MAEGEGSRGAAWIRAPLWRNCGKVGSQTEGLNKKTQVIGLVTRVVVISEETREGTILETHGETGVETSVETHGETGVETSVETREETGEETRVETGVETRWETDVETRGETRGETGGDYCE